MQTTLISLGLSFVHLDPIGDFLHFLGFPLKINSPNFLYIAATERTNSVNASKASADMRRRTKTSSVEFFG